MRLSLICLNIVLLFLLVNTGWAGEAGRGFAAPQAAGIDTARLLSDQPLKSPWGAAARSAVLPGWGQIYNHAYWKAGLAAGVNGYLLYRIIDNQRKFNQTRNRDFRNARNTHYWYLGVTYLLTLADAYVDAYLFGFDEAMNITVLPTDAAGGSVWLSLRVNF